MRKMRQFVNRLNMLVFIFLYFGPLHSMGSGTEMRNFFNDYRRDSTHYTPINENEEKAINIIIDQIFKTNLTASPRIQTTPNLNPRSAQPRSLPLPIPTASTISNANSRENITTGFYSTDVENYPDYSVIATKLRKFQGLAFRDSLPKPTLSSHSLLEPEPYKYRHLCASQIDLITPREIKDRANRSVRVVNYPQFEQKIRAEVCREKDAACDYSANFPNHLIPICKQNYIFRQVLLMTKSDDPDLFVDDVSIPACCECVLKDITMD